MSSTTQVVRGATDQTGSSTTQYPILLVDSLGRLITSSASAAASGSTTSTTTNSSGARFNATPPTFASGQLAENQADANGNQKVTIAARPLMDRSVALAANTQVTLIPINLSRTGFFIKNDSAVDIWINMVGAAAASAGAGNIKIAANGYFELKGVSNAVSAIATAAAAITAGEF